MLRSRLSLLLCLATSILLARDAVGQLPSASCGSIFPNCGGCDDMDFGQNVVCRGCIDGFGQQKGACVPCSTIDPACRKCKEGVCLSCEGGYVDKGGLACFRCSTIDPRCVGCAKELCSQCESGYGVAAGGTRCLQCSSIDPACVTCNDKCTGCQPGYGVATSGTSCRPCSSIDAACLACSGDKCTACQAGYGVATGGAKCERCASFHPACTTCDGGSCTACQPGYGLRKDRSPPIACERCAEIRQKCSACLDGKCTGCRDGFASQRSKDGECVQPGTEGCKHEVGGQCCACLAGQYLDDGQCRGLPRGNLCDESARQ